MCFVFASVHSFGAAFNPWSIFVKLGMGVNDSGRHLVSVLPISYSSANNMAESGTCSAGETLAPLNFYVLKWCVVTVEE